MEWVAGCVWLEYLIVACVVKVLINWFNVTCCHPYCLSLNEKQIDLLYSKKKCDITQIAVAIYSTQVVCKAWDYGCFLSVRHFAFLSRDHTLCSECDERQWVIDAHGPSAHLLCSTGGSFLRDAQPLCEVLGCGKMHLGHDGETPQISNFQLSPTLHHSLPTLLQPHQTVLRQGLFTDQGGRWAPLGFWLPCDLRFFFSARTCGLRINVMIKVQRWSVVEQLFEVNSLFQHILSLLTNAGPVFIPVTLTWL